MGIDVFGVKIVGQEPTQTLNTWSFGQLVVVMRVSGEVSLKKGIVFE